MSTLFVDALINGDLDAIRRCPKADLHNHGGLSGDRAFLFERTGINVAPVDRKLNSMDEMHTWVKTNVGPAFKDDKKGMLGFEAALALAKRDGVTRIEFGYDVWAITWGWTAGDLTQSLESSAPP